MSKNFNESARQGAFITYDAPSSAHPFLSVHGESPSGSMRVIFSPDKVCKGFDRYRGVFSILYSIPSGIQSGIHPHPGCTYDGFQRRVVYLPASPEGSDLLARFMVAFQRGFMFKIGKSITSGLDNQTIWSSIPQKTSLHGGMYGYPDGNYITAVNLELDKVNIPSASECILIFQQGLSGEMDGDDKDEDDSSFPVKSETIFYDAPASLVDGNNFADILRPLPTTSPRTAVADGQIQKQTTIAANMATAPTAPTAPTNRPAKPMASMRPAKIVTAGDFPDNPTTGFGTTPVLLASAPVELTDNQTPPMQVPCAPVDFTDTPTTGSAPMPPPAIGTASGMDKATCSICLNKLTEELSVEVIHCRHAFHKTCIVGALNHIGKCPICRQPISGRLQGKSPSGTMKIELTQAICPGFNGSKTISIIYDLPSGIQESYHENSGISYHGTSRKAYLPTNLEGRKLLMRLKLAFSKGLTFGIGTSLTTGRKNQITWTSIHHKTSLSGGAHGFPDDKYILNCNSSLDALHVPPAEKCRLAP